MSSNVTHKGFASFDFEAVRIGDTRAGMSVVRFSARDNTGDEAGSPDY